MTQWPPRQKGFLGLSSMHCSQWTWLIKDLPGNSVGWPEPCRGHPSPENGTAPGHKPCRDHWQAPLLFLWSHRSCIAAFNSIQLESQGKTKLNVFKLCHFCLTIYIRSGNVVYKFSYALWRTLAKFHLVNYYKEILTSNPVPDTSPL